MRCTQVLEQRKRKEKRRKELIHCPSAFIKGIHTYIHTHIRPRKAQYHLHFSSCLVSFLLYSVRAVISRYLSGLLSAVSGAQPPELEPKKTPKVKCTSMPDDGKILHTIACEKSSVGAIDTRRMSRMSRMRMYIIKYKYKYRIRVWI